MTDSKPPVRKVYTLDDYRPFLAGEAPLPNWEELETSEWYPQYAGFLNTLAAVGHSLDPYWGRSRGTRYGRFASAWTMYFLAPMWLIIGVIVVAMLLEANGFAVCGP